MYCIVLDLTFLFSWKIVQIFILLILRIYRGLNTRPDKKLSQIGNSASARP